MLIDRITNARVAGHDGLVDISIANGLVTGVGAATSGVAFDAMGRAVVPAFIDAHVHLDKAFLGEDASVAPTLAAAIEHVELARASHSLDDVRSNAERAVDTLVRHGVVAARAHVEISPTVGRDLVDLHLDLAKAVADRCELQLVAFPQIGMGGATATLLARALEDGLHAVGACPYVDDDPAAHLDAVFGLAERFDVPVDVHLDFSDEAAASQLGLVIERTQRSDMQGRVTVGHVTTLAAFSADDQARAFDAMASAGVALVVMPATDLYLGGHGEPGLRSLAPIERAIAAGVTVAIANNNLANPFAPFGNGNIVQAAWLAGVMRRMNGASERAALLDAITAAPATILDRPAHGPVVGASADLVVLDAPSPESAVTQAPAVVATIHRGAITYASDFGKATLINAQRLSAGTRNNHGVAYGEMSIAAPARYLLPPSAYRDSEWFARERAALFTRRWTLVGREEDFATAGDFVATTVGDAPLVIVRGDDGRLRAFHNLCRHRGMQMLDGAGNCELSITCFYHQWRYGLDGALKVVPQSKEQFPDLDRSLWGLLPASVDTWSGMVFAHPDAAASPLADLVAPLEANMGSYRPGELAQVAAVDLIAECNWKLFVENHIDVYHLWYLHERSLGDFDHTKFEHTAMDGDWFSYEPLRGALEDAALTRGTTTIGHLAERDRMGIGAHLLFPSLMFATTAEFFASYQAVPLAADRTRIELRVLAEPSADADALLAATRSFIEEDIAACERVQAGVASPAFGVGPLAAEHEAPITRFHERVLARLEEVA